MLPARRSESKELVVRDAGNGGKFIAPAPPATVLEEDTYVEALDKIIQRDFFPDLEKLRNQHEWLEAKERGDTATMLRIRQKYSKRHASATPGNLSMRRETGRPFETPAFDRTPMRMEGFPVGIGDGIDLGSAEPGSKRRKLTDEADADPNAPQTTAKTDLSLDSFTTKYTSEDNAAFSEILEKNAEWAKQRYWWYFKNQKTEQQQQLLIEPPPSSPGVITWKHEPLNALMYTPDGVPSDNLVEQAAKKVIQHQNTRFSAQDLAAMDPERRKKMQQDQLVRSQQERASMLIRDPSEVFLEKKYEEKNKKIDLDDLLGTPRPQIPASPRVRGYGFVTTPSPHPGDGSDPFMTWGDIEGDPLMLDPGFETPLDVAPATGPEFKVPERSARENIAMKLADDVIKRKSKAAPSPLIGISSAASPHRTPQRLSHQAHAMAQRMMSEKLTSQSADMQLRSSYGGASSPFNASPSPSPRRTPASTPFASPAPRKPATPSITRRSAPPPPAPSAADSSSGSLTDGLLKI